MTTILSLRISASSIEWVVMIMALSFFIYSINCQTNYLDTGSIPVVGSSKNIILGFPTLAIASDNLLFIPPLKVLTKLFLTFDN